MTCFFRLPFSITFFADWLNFYLQLLEEGPISAVQKANTNKAFQRTTFNWHNFRGRCLPRLIGLCLLILCHRCVTVITALQWGSVIFLSKERRLQFGKGPSRVEILLLQKFLKFLWNPLRISFLISGSDTAPSACIILFNSSWARLRQLSGNSPSPICIPASCLIRQTTVTVLLLRSNCCKRSL